MIGLPVGASPAADSARQRAAGELAGLALRKSAALRTIMGGAAQRDGIWRGDRQEPAAARETPVLELSSAPSSRVTVSYVMGADGSVQAYCGVGLETQQELDVNHVGRAMDGVDGADGCDCADRAYTAQGVGLDGHECAPVCTCSYPYGLPVHSEADGPAPVVAVPVGIDLAGLEDRGPGARAATREAAQEEGTREAAQEEGTREAAQEEGTREAAAGRHDRHARLSAEALSPCAVDTEWLDTVGIDLREHVQTGWPDTLGIQPDTMGIQPAHPAQGGHGGGSFDDAFDHGDCGGERGVRRPSAANSMDQEGSCGGDGDAWYDGDALEDELVRECLYGTSLRASGVRCYICCTLGMSSLGDALALCASDLCS